MDAQIGPIGIAVTRHVRHEHVTAVMGEVACLHGPDRVVETCTVQEHDGGLTFYGLTRAGVGVSLCAVYFKFHKRVIP